VKNETNSEITAERDQVLQTKYLGKQKLQKETQSKGRTKTRI